MLGQLPGQAWRGLSVSASAWGRSHHAGARVKVLSVSLCDREAQTAPALPGCTAEAADVSEATWKPQPQPSSQLHAAACVTLAGSVPGS